VTLLPNLTLEDERPCRQFRTAQYSFVQPPIRQSVPETSYCPVLSLSVFSFRELLHGIITGKYLG